MDALNNLTGKLNMPAPLNWNGLDYLGLATATPTQGSMNYVNDALGLTDTQAGQRGLSAMEGRANAASQQLHQNMQPVLDMYGNAMDGRAMGDVISSATDALGATGNLDVNSWMNPMASTVLDSAANQALAGAGSSLQSSGANNAVATAVGNQQAQLWQQAFDNALADAENKQRVAKATTDLNLMPSLNWAQLTSDMAGTEYTKDMDLAQSAGQVAGQNQSWFGNLF